MLSVYDAQALFIYIYIYVLYLYLCLCLDLDVDPDPDLELELDPDPDRDPDIAIDVPIWASDANYTRNVLRPRSGEWPMRSMLGHFAKSYLLPFPKKRKMM